MNVERILKVHVGSPKPKLHLEAVAIYTLCKQYQIHLEPEWVPREFNQEADELSRLASKYDYMLTPNTFAALDIFVGTAHSGPFFHLSDMTGSNVFCRPLAESMH